jgi:hypothetical protein
VRLAFETAAEQGQWHGAVGKVAKQLGIGPESLRHWVHQEEIDRGTRSGLTTDEREHMKALDCLSLVFRGERLRNVNRPWRANVWARSSHLAEPSNWVSVVEWDTACRCLIQQASDHHALPTIPKLGLQHCLPLP